MVTKNKILIGATMMITVVIFVGGCLTNDGCNDESNGEDVIPNVNQFPENTTLNVTQSTEPVIKHLEEAVDLVKEKHLEVSGMAEENITVLEILDGWNITFFKQEKACEDRCIFTQYFYFEVYENGTVIKTSEDNEIDTNVTLLEKFTINIPKGEKNGDFIIRSLQTGEGTIWGENITVKYEAKNVSRPVEIRVNNWTNVSYINHFLEVTLLGETLTFDFSGDHYYCTWFLTGSCVMDSCSNNVCSYNLWRGFEKEEDDEERKVREYTRFRFKVMPVTWVVNGSDVVPSYPKWEGDDLYVVAEIENYQDPIIDVRYHDTKWIEISVTESKNIEFIGYNMSADYPLENLIRHNITINYLESSPMQIFEVIVDGRKERFEIDPNNEIMLVDGIERGKWTIYKYGSNIRYEYFWQKDEIYFTLYPQPEDTWNVTKLSITISPTKYPF